MLPRLRSWATSFRRFSTRMSDSMLDYFSPPEAVRGSTELDRAAFHREFELPCIKLASQNLCGMFLKHLAHACLKCPYRKSIVNVPSVTGQKEPDKVILLMPPDLIEKQLTQEDYQWIAENGGVMSTHRFNLEYANYTSRGILQAVLPTDLEIPHSYELVGHIAHYNLKREYLPYQNVIGQVIVDKMPIVRTAVNKTDKIDNTFRFFKMDLIAGEEDYVAKLKENNCTFTFDYSKVYWNSRLGTEHQLVVDLIEPGEVILDVFAGVGPFAIPAGKNKDCTVYANDLNPHSYAYLKENAKANRVASRVHCYNQDGRDFISSVTARLVEKSLSSRAKLRRGSVVAYSHVIMNLPAQAAKFLDVFCGLFRSVPEDARPFFQLPTIHCYCFVPNEEEEKEAVETVMSYLRVNELEKGSYTVEEVRLVSPKKAMMRVSFKLPREVAYMDTSCAVCPQSAKEETAKTLGAQSGVSEDVQDQATTGAQLEEPATKRSKLDQTTFA